MPLSPIRPLECRFNVLTDVCTLLLVATCPPVENLDNFPYHVMSIVLDQNIVVLIYHLQISDKLESMAFQRKRCSLIMIHDGKISCRSCILFQQALAMNKIFFPLTPVP